jgi:hypothetical protein
VFGDELKVAIALAGCHRGRVAEHAIPTRRHDDGRVGMTGRDTGVNAFLIISAVAGERGYGSDHLIGQRANLGAVINIIRGQHRSDDPPGVGIHSNVPLPPGSAPTGGVRLDPPLAGTTRFQPRAVHQQVRGFGTGAQAGRRYLQRLGAAAQGGMVGRRTGEAEQVKHGADEALCLPACQPKHGPERQGRQDRQRRVGRLTAPRGPRRGLPGRDGRLGDQTVKLPR